MGRTSKAHVSEMLVGAVTVVAYTSSTFVSAERFHWINPVAVSQRLEATWDVLEKVRVPTIVSEQFENTFVWCVVCSNV